MIAYETEKDISESNNFLTKELSSVEFIKQPYLYAMVGADFSLYQRNIMIEIIKSMQDRFNEFLKISVPMDRYHCSPPILTRIILLRSELVLLPLE